ncbi:MAG: peptide chain release factor N(5)-glutamine methyltransferase [Clostridiales bacterium]|jgi:release factor glutamine methyltransferase|nr:peptide chain release factor N(5)-glutamine methyltransferase [Clostridiales bacterium]
MKVPVRMPVNRIDQLRKVGRSKLKNKFKDPSYECDLLLCYVLNVDRTYLFKNPEHIVEDSKAEKLLSLLEERCKNVPIQYLTGSQIFMGLDFFVNSDVLIPRPDTEILVENAIKILPESARVLDLCTGSGCIGISIAFYRKDIIMTCSDISDSAIKVAKKNALGNGVYNIDFATGNLFEPFDGVKFDGVVSNPPYIPEEDITALEPQVKDYEPQAALNGGRDGMDFYRKIISQAPLFLSNYGILMLESGINQSDKIVELMSKNFSEPVVLQDLNGIKRVVQGKLF